ncbi:MAG: hypothetical protein WCW44_00665 [archaeon]|jgi:hypothetical protein
MIQTNGSRILIKERLRRTKTSPSFLATGRGEYSIVKAGAPIKITANLTGEKVRTIEFLEGQRKIAIFQAQEDSPRVWNIYHRMVIREHRGYNIGLHGFRLLEQQIRKIGGKEILLKTNQKEVIRTLLKLGYSMNSEHKQELCGCLQLPRNATTKQIITALEGTWLERPHELTLYRKLE